MLCCCTISLLYKQQGVICVSLCYYGPSNVDLDQSILYPVSMSHAICVALGLDLMDAAKLGAVNGVLEGLLQRPVRKASMHLREQPEARSL